MKNLLNYQSSEYDCGPVSLLIGAHLIIAFCQAVQALCTDYPVGTLGLIRDKGDTVFEIFLIQFRARYP